MWRREGWAAPVRACREEVRKNKEISEFADWCWCDLTQYAVDASYFFDKSLGVCVN
jgi:hypothetical protein